MNDRQLEAFWHRPMKVDVFTRCPVCEKLVQGVEKRKISIGFGQLLEQECCTPCVQVVKDEYAAVVVT